MEDRNNTSNNELTINDIVAIFKSFSDKKRMKEIKEAIALIKFPDQTLFLEDERDIINKKVEQVIKEDKNCGDTSYLKYANGKYSKRPNRKQPDCKIPQQTGYTGTAGECAVISELLFAGYNANRMMLDEGIDIIATKDNKYYYVQVKTTFINAGKIQVQIKSDRFKAVGDNIYYVIVARYEKDGAWSNMFFSFTASQINNHIYDGYIKKGSDNISIKIKINPRNGEPYLYNDSKERPCAFNWNKQDLLRDK